MLNRGVFGISAVLVLLAAAFSAELSAAPPMDGYGNVTYTYGTTYSDYIDDVRILRGSTVLLQNMNTGGAGSPYNTFYGGITPALLIPGQTHTVEMTITTAYDEYHTAFIDYNNDGDFLDSGETLGTNYVAPGGTGTINFTPSAAASGIRRLRIVQVWASAGPHSPTGSYGYGEVEDYLVNLGFSITTEDPLPSAALGLSYQSDIVAANGTAPYNWQGATAYITGGSLPPGITAAPFGNPAVLRLSGMPTVANSYSFTVSVIDSAAKTATKTFNLTVFPAPAALPFTDDFSTNKSWAKGGGWTWGVATAYSATVPTRSEPGTDNTATSDNLILGHNRGADYANNMGATEWAVSPPVNCQAAASVRLKFFRWLGVSPYDNARIQVTTNGSTWTDVWASTTSTINDTAWTSVFYPLSVAGQPFVQVRFGIGPTDGTVANVGWCIDDFVIEVPGPDLEVREGGATGALLTDGQAVGGLRDFGTVNVSQQSAPLTIAVTNAGPSSISLAGGITKTGTNPTDFIMNAAGYPATLAVGQTATFTITFYRTTAGVSTCVFNLFHNAGGSGTSPFEINVRGEAVVPIPVLEVRLATTTGPIIPHQDPPAGTVRDFGNQDVTAGPTASITIVVMNTGTGNLGVATPDMGGTWWNQYTINSAGFVSTLAPGASTSFTVAFDPDTVGSKPASVRISHTDGSKPSPYLVDVIGVGTSPGPTLNVGEGAAPGSSFAHNAPAAGTARDFGNWLITAGPTTPPLIISINNTGTGSMTVGMPVKGGADPGEFVLDTAGFTTTVAPGNSTSFTIAFDPTTVGPKTATVTFTHNDPNATSPFIVNVMGNGVNTSGTASVHATNAAGPILPNPAPATGVLNFGDQDYNSGPTPPAIIYVENTGTGPLTLGNPVFNPPSAEFTIQGAGFAGTLPVGSSATFEVRFDPTSVGTKTAIVRFTHDDPNTNNPYVLNVTGNGILNSPLISVREGATSGPNITSSAAPVAGASRDFGNQTVTAGPSAPITIFIINNGTLDLNLGTPVITGPNSGSFVLGTGGFSPVIGPGASATIDVMFDPALGGIKDAQLEFTQDDVTQPSPYIVMFTGTAVDPAGVMITTTSVPAATSGVAYTPLQFNATQGSGPYTWSVYSGSIPGGMNFSAAGVLDGTPGGFGGQLKFVVRVTDATGATDEQLISLVVIGGLNGKGRAKGGGGCATQGGSPATGLGLGVVALLAAASFGLRRRKEA